MRVDSKESKIECPSRILAIEFISDRKSIAVSLSDRTILFYDTNNNFKKLNKELNMPSTQKCLAYIERKKCLFSAGIDGAIFAWNLDKLFTNDRDGAGSFNYG